jgi:hypothetical protein
MRMVEWISGKIEYTEDEAATALGISVGELRALVQTHVIREEVSLEVPVPIFRPTDLLLLRMLAESHPHLTRVISRKRIGRALESYAPLPGSCFPPNIPWPTHRERCIAAIRPRAHSKDRARRCILSEAGMPKWKTPAEMPTEGVRNWFWPRTS